MKEVAGSPFRSRGDNSYNSRRGHPLLSQWSSLRTNGTFHTNVIPYPADFTGLFHARRPVGPERVTLVSPYHLHPRAFDQLGGLLGSFRLLQREIHVTTPVWQWPVLRAQDGWRGKNRCRHDRSEERPLSTPISGRTCRRISCSWSSSGCRSRVFSTSAACVRAGRTSSSSSSAVTSSGRSRAKAAAGTLCICDFVREDHDDTSFTLVASAHGLLCFSTCSRVNEYVICNPLTGAFRWVIIGCSYFRMGEKEPSCPGTQDSRSFSSAWFRFIGAAADSSS